MREDYWHSIMKSNGRGMVTVPNRPEKFQFPLSLCSNGSGISEMRWIECQVREKRFSSKCVWTQLSGVWWTVTGALMIEAHWKMHPAKYLHCPWLLIKTLAFIVRSSFVGASLSLRIGFGIGTAAARNVTFRVRKEWIYILIMWLRMSLHLDWYKMSCN